MRVLRGVWVLVMAATGCHGPGRECAPPPEHPARSNELPVVARTELVLDGRDLPRLPPRSTGVPPDQGYRGLSELDCQLLAAGNSSLASLFDEENELPSRGRDCAKDHLFKILRYYTALELRNRAAAEALERFVQLLEVETRTDLLRKSFPIVDNQITRARAARAADVRYPLDVSDLARDRLQLESQLEQAENGSRLLNLDLKRRLNLSIPEKDRLWPVGDFAIDPTPIDPDRAVASALADRPELRGLRALCQGFTVEMLPAARELLRTGGPLLGQGNTRFPLCSPLCVQWQGPSSSSQAELAIRKKQLSETLAERERAIADETRAAVLTANSQRIRAALARDRVLLWEDKLADAEKKRAAKQPGAEFLVPQIQLELLKARSELAAEVAAWHQARIKVRAAGGWLAWESLKAR